MNIDQDMAKAIKLAQAGKLKPAIAILDGLVKAAPSAIPVRYNLALFLLMAGRHAEALPHLDRILAAQPGHAPSLFSKAKGLLALDRAPEALPILERLAVGNDPESLLALGNALRQLQRMDEAAQAFRRLTKVAPAFPGGHMNLCILLVSSNNNEAALNALDEAVRLHPKLSELHAMRGQMLLRLGHHGEAIAALKAALEINPALAPAKGRLLRAYRETADWDSEDRLFTEIRAAIATGEAKGQLPLTIQDALFYPFTGEEMRRIAGLEVAFRVPGQPRPVLRPQPKATPPLVVGYLSPDYREHATMHLAGDIFAAHDRSRVRPLAYSVGPDDGSGWRERVERHCEAFVDLSSSSDRAAAERIAADGVQILVDMSVFTRHARPGIAALRPAPVQTVWLGLAASSACPWMDYAIVDSVLVPPAHGGHFTEKLIRLPDTYQANLAWTPPGERPSREALGLPEDRLVLCSFNGHRKLDRASFALWLEILADLPQAVLWQLSPPDMAKRRLEDAAAKAGIDPARLIWAPSLPRAEHLARLPAADLFVDALVCGAHTTAADSLRMGVPLVTVAGERLGSRVAASILNAVGLPELAVQSAAAMRDLVVALGRNPSRLADLRTRLTELLPASAAFDPARFARHLEAGYEAAWARHAAGKKPEDITL
ncbi:TPR domain protein putative component of TonB system [Paramagnetospirillum magnetotacticum MS-1]|uniref:protein O-GlcNAc transferase n=1 Tax=Paramagnetospirillum magnetotacticum MS-1 TaxID=272627 RepID=A0A0C2YW34_PARME|nr:tetratricopeptide repeat protein [Paramagnetospirillum magnetotacticum]KIL98915.1 TPR domain protein putative component of TonB system [Paramagnetospirillum magnetotacticum MS-1]